METLVRIHDTAHGTGFFTDHGSQLNVSARGDMTTDKFLSIDVLQEIDPDPSTSGLTLKGEYLWLHLSQRQYVGGICLMTIPDHLVEQATSAVATCAQRLAKRAS